MFWNSPYLLLLLATCLWGGNFVMGSVLVHEVPPFTLSLFRWFVAFVCLVPFAGKAALQHLALFRIHWKAVMFLSLTGVFGFNTLVYIAVEYTSPINGALMNSATPIIILLLSLFFLNEKVTFYRVAGILISLAGVLCIITRGSVRALMTLNFNPGDLWMVLAVFVWALYSIAMKKTARLFPANALFLATIASALILLIPASFAELFFSGASFHVRPDVVLGILYLGIFASIVAFSCWNRAVELIGPSRCASFLNFIPLFSTLFSIAFLGDRVHVYHFLGAVFILLGVYVTARVKREIAAPKGNMKEKAPC